MNLQTYPPVDLPSFSKFLERQLEHFLSKPDPKTRSPFNTAPLTDEGLRAGVDHLVKYAPCSSECFVFALIYLNRLDTLHPKFVNVVSVGQIFFVAVMLASKYYDDTCFDNESYSRILMIKRAKLKRLELELLDKMSFHCGISDSDFESISSRLTTLISVRDGFSVSKRTHDLLSGNAD
jgi:Cyclin